MRTANPRLRRLANRLLSLDVSSRESGVAPGSTAFAACDRLRQSLSTLVGANGFRSLLSRALALAGDEVRWLKTVHINSDGTLNALDAGQLSKAEIAEGEAVLVAQLTGLLVTFIGEALTQRLLQEAWPEVPLGGLDSEPERE